MSYLLFIGLGWWLTVLSMKNGIPIDDTTWLCLAILTAWSGGEICTEWYAVEDLLDNAPTIIEAEEGE